MTETIIASIVIAIILGVLGWFKIWGRNTWDRRKIYRWLKSNTHDKPYESHADIISIAKGTKLPEDRVRRACLSCNNIFLYSNGKEQWSVWRQEPQSAYDGLTKEEILNEMRF